ncbi:MAG: hypothetical protein ACRC41_07835 [Sarcina sp.]
MSIESIKSLLDKSEKFDVHKKFLRVSLMNKDSDKVFSEFYNFNNTLELIEFINKFIIPSIALTLLSEENGEIMLVLDEDNSFSDFIKSLDKDDDIRLKIENTYNLINLFEVKKISLEELLNELSFELSEGQITLISLDYAESVKVYLEGIYKEYKSGDNLDILEKELARINLCLGGFLDICENIDKYQGEIKEKLLDKLPY